MNNQGCFPTIARCVQLFIHQDVLDKNGVSWYSSSTIDAKCETFRFDSQRKSFLSILVVKKVRFHPSVCNAPAFTIGAPIDALPFVPIYQGRLAPRIRL